jgi:hypothetical protein
MRSYDSYYKASSSVYMITIDDDEDNDYIHDDDACMYASSVIRPDRLPVSISTPSYASPSSLLCYLVDTKSE